MKDAEFLKLITENDFDARFKEGIASVNSVSKFECDEQTATVFYDLFL